jgi:hypothetical protein
MTYTIISGTTALLRFQLLEAGSPIDLSGCTVTLLLSDKTGTAVTSPGTVTIEDATNGEVSLTPTNTAVFDSTLGPYMARWKIVDPSTKVYYVPSSATRDIWNIVGA